MSTFPQATLEFGHPIPANDEHAVSAEITNYDQFMAMCEGDEQVIAKIRISYPRFYLHPYVMELMQKITETYGLPDKAEKCLLFPSEKVADNMQKWVAANSEFSHFRVVHASTRLPPQFETSHVYAVFFPEEAFDVAKSFWAVTGEGISSRRAKYFLEFGFSPETTTLTPLNPMFESEAKSKVITRLSHLYDVQPDNVYLYPSGMSSIFAAHELFMKLTNAVAQNFQAVLYGFAFKDTPKLLNKWGPGCLWYPDGTEEELDNLELHLQKHRISGLWLEVPSNPNLKTANLERIRGLADKYNFLICVDDTLGYMINVDILKYVDVAVSSLTKVFNGSCNAMAGALIVNPKGINENLVIPTQRDLYQDNLWAEDAIVLEESSRDVVARAQAINSSTPQVVDFFRKHEKVKNVWYTLGSDTQKNYDAVKKPSGGYGGLFLVEFKSPEIMQKFYDTIALHKGPSLGTNCTLVFPYVYAAHGEDLDFVEQHGIPRHSLRFSIGLEPADLLIAEFKHALS